MKTLARLFLFFWAILNVCESISVTYPGIGTFTIFDYYDPIWRPIIALPNPPELLFAKFMLYTRKNPDKPDYLHWNFTDDYSKTNFDPRADTKIIAYGYIEDLNLTKWPLKMKNHLLIAGNHNVILLDWPFTNKNLFYPKVTANSRVLGIMIGILIENLHKHFNVSYESFHLVGHSLAAHMMGYAGKHLKKKGILLPRITGLDPAGPYFEHVKQTGARLWHTDARFVDVIHTDGSSLIDHLGFGMWETCGHVDIYVNGGRRGQPGCNRERITTILTGLRPGLARIFVCNHLRATDYFIESILETVSLPVAYLCDDYQSFKHNKCTSCAANSTNCVVLGQYSPRYLQMGRLNEYVGKRYFMSTADRSKFFKFQYLINIKMGRLADNSSIIPRKVTLRFIDRNENTEKFTFNKEFHIFGDELKYPHVAVLNINPERLELIEFKWKCGLDLLTHKMIIKQLEVTALSYKKELRSPTKFTFKPEQNEITSDEWITFKKQSQTILLPDSITN